MSNQNQDRVDVEGILQDCRLEISETIHLLSDLHGEAAMIVSELCKLKPSMAGIGMPPMS